jgi:hypothetical protein
MSKNIVVDLELFGYKGDLSKKHNILSLIIPYMFQDMKNFINDTRTNLDEYMKRMCIGEFNTIYTDLSVIEGECHYDEYTDSIEKLAYIGSSTELYSTTKRLVDCLKILLNVKEYNLILTLTNPTLFDHYRKNIELILSHNIFDRIDFKTSTEIKKLIGGKDGYNI